MRSVAVIGSFFAMVLLSGCAASSPSSARSDATPTSTPVADSAAAPAAHDPVAAAPTTAPADEQSPLTAFDNFHVIEAGRAYRSAQVRPESLAYFARTHKIRSVLNLRGENAGAAWYDAEKKACTELGLQLIDIRLSAAALPSPENLLKLFDAVKSAPEPLLLHCKAGADRTGMAAGVWCMVQRGDDPSVAARQLSVAYGHFRSVHPEMDQLVALFKADRAWIQNEYPKLYAERTAAAPAGKRGASKADD